MQVLREHNLSMAQDVLKQKMTRIQEVGDVGKAVKIKVGFGLIQ